MSKDCKILLCAICFLLFLAYSKMFPVEHSTKFFRYFNVSRGTYNAHFLVIVDNFSIFVGFLWLLLKTQQFLCGQFPRFFSKFSEYALTRLNLCIFCG